jgi:head decoration protein D
MTTGIVQTESKHAGCFMVSEAEGRRSRDKVVVALNQTLVAGQVIGRTVAGTVTSSVAADAGNTGNGVFTLDGTAPVGAGAKDGNYRVVNDLVATNSGEFIVTDPDGIEIGRVAVGATFNNQIKFVIADGATDFAIGDAFTVTVGIEDADYQVAVLNPAGTDGTQRAAGILWDNVTTGGTATIPAVAITREAEVRGADLTWPAGITAAQQAEAIRQLEKQHIIVR